MIQWEPAMATGVAVVDRQHKELVAQVNELVSAMKAGKGRQLVGDTLVFLGRYAVEHFSTEEALMRKHGYPGYERHKGIHEAFKQDFGALAGDFDSGTQNLSLTIQVQQKVMGWLRSHILRVDGELGKFLREKEVA